MGGTSRLRWSGHRLHAEITVPIDPDARLADLAAVATRLEEGARAALPAAGAGRRSLSLGLGLRARRLGAWSLGSRSFGSRRLLALRFRTLRRAGPFAGVVPAVVVGLGPILGQGRAGGSGQQGQRQRASHHRLHDLTRWARPLGARAVVRPLRPTDAPGKLNPA